MKVFKTVRLKFSLRLAPLPALCYSLPGPHLVATRIRPSEHSRFLPNYFLSSYPQRKSEPPLPRIHHHTCTQTQLFHPFIDGLFRKTKKKNQFCLLCGLEFRYYGLWGNSKSECRFVAMLKFIQSILLFFGVKLDI